MNSIGPVNVPHRSDIVQMVASHMYSGRILNNSHRGDLVEMMTLAALGPEWKHVGLGWHPWDLQRGKGDERSRLRVKQTAAVQLWGSTIRRTLHFGWKNQPPASFEDYNPGERIESEGWMCDGFVFGIHDETNRDVIDQADPCQWSFLVINTDDLNPRTNSMSLSKARALWSAVPWESLRHEVEKCFRIG
jgi:hypothetical protein